jgi:4-amino-4-deoxy-L-arabinose transferase-like glycosyltransferase
MNRDARLAGVMPSAQPVSSTAVDTAPATPGATRLAATAALLVWALVTSFLRVSAAPVYIPNEAREGVFARAMLDMGNFVLPTVPSHVENGETIPDKPPLTHWLSAAVTALRVSVTDGHLPNGPALAARYDDWSLRFPSGLFAVVTVAGVLLLGRHLVGDRAALLAGAALLASWQFVHHARFGRVDMPLCGCVTLTMLLAGRALVDGAAEALVLAAGAAGLAVLAKGPLGAALPCIACAIFVLCQALRERSIERWRFLPWGRAAGVFVLVALPWYGAAVAVGGMAVVRSQLVKETFGQFTGANAEMWAFYYLLPWLQDSAPWNLFAVWGVWCAWRARDPRAGFCAVWWVSFLAIFQLSAYKRQAYLLPAVPAGALLGGYAMDRWLGARDESVRSAIAAAVPPWWRRALGGGLVAAVAGASVGYSGVGQRWLGTELLPVDGALAGGGIALGAAAIVALGRALVWRQAAAAVVALWTAQVLIYLGPVATGEVVVAQRQSPVPLVRHMLAKLAPDQTVTVIGLGDAASLLLILYFPTLAHIAVVPQRAGIPATLPPGFYLLSDSAWSAISAAARDRTESSTGNGWRLLWADTLRARDNPIPLVFAERLG